MSRDQVGVAQLPSAGVPADHGLSSLGLVMQLAGTIMAAAVSLLAFVKMVSLTLPYGGGYGVERSTALYMFVLFMSCAVRSAFHRIAGTQLLYGPRRIELEDSPQVTNPLAGLYRYIVVGLVHSVVFAIGMKLLFEISTSMTIGIALGLAVWPAVLGALVASGTFPRFAAKIPVAEDKGFESAAILMTVLGACGVLSMCGLLLAMLELGGDALHEGPVILVMIAVVLLVVRSVLHFQAGVSGLRTTSIDRSVELANRYAGFGVISSLCAGGAMLLGVMMGKLDVTLLAITCAVTWMLMTWPMIVRRFFGDRQFADLIAGENADVHRRAPDAGLSGLGWLLLAHAAYGATCLIPGLIGNDASSDLGKLFELAVGGGLRSPWWSVGICVLEAWAGFELIKMTAHHRAIAILYAVVAMAVTVFMYWPTVKAIGHASQQQMLVMLPVAISLVLPVSVLVLVNRNIAPAARARFRAKT